MFGKFVFKLIKYPLVQLFKLSFVYIYTVFLSILTLETSDVDFFKE